MDLSDPLYRDPGPSRRLENANDWYGVGYLFEVTGQGYMATVRRWVYCSGAGAYEQFLLGQRHAQEQDIATAMSEAP